MKNLFLIFLTLCALNVTAQTDYHTNLLDQWSTLYGLTGGTWAIPSDEQQVLNSTSSYGGSVSNVSPAPTGVPFTKAKKQIISTAGANPWDAAFFISNTVAIASGDRLLATVWVRSANPNAVVANLYIENLTTYDKEIYASATIPTTWTQMIVPFDANVNYAVNKVRMGFHSGGTAGVSIEFGGFALRNYGTSVTLDQLPTLLNQYYEGSEPDAAWRGPAADSIESIRKANMNVNMKDLAGATVAGAQVKIKMLQHQFKFGSAITANRIANNNAQDDTYQSKILDFDGEGHGFNEIVYENDMKWDAWEEHWFESQANIAKSVKWLNDRNISVRGHNLVWPGWNLMPDDMLVQKTNLPYLKNRLLQRVQKMLTYPGLEGKIKDWDIINEMTVNEDLANAFKNSSGYPTGREIYVDILKKVKEVDPSVISYLNDYVTLDQNYLPTHPTYIKCKQFVQEAITAGAPVDAIGFQAHIGAGMLSMYRTKATLDDFYNSFNTHAKITEYDLNKLVNDSTAAKFTSDFLTLCFAHPSVDGFLMWGFWDAAHWYDHAPLFNEDWSPKPSVGAISQLLFHDWWTPETTLVTDAAGNADLRGFKGVYEITHICNGVTIKTDTIDFFNNLQLDLVCGIVDAEEADVKDFEVRFPSPVAVNSNVAISFNEVPAQVRLVDVAGRVLETWSKPTGVLEIIINETGVFFWDITRKNGEKMVKQVVVE
jgi:endo-1,4-beta-xylanase